MAHNHLRSNGSGVGTWAYHHGSMATSHRNSHTVPEFYLRAFAENGHVLLAERGGAPPRRVGVRRATAEADFYAFRAPGGRLSQELEDDVLHRVEREAAPVHRAMRAGVLPIGRHRLTYALFLGLAGVRTRRFRQMGFNAVDPDDADDLGVGEDEFHNHLIRTAMLVLWPKMTRLVGLLDWRLLEVPPSEGFGFVTADHPVGLWTEDPDRVERVGLLSADAIVHPVDPRRVLVMKRPDLPWPRWAMSSDSRAISHVNWAMEQIAHKELIMIPRSGAQRLTRIRGRSAFVSGGEPRLQLAHALPIWTPARPDDDTSWSQDDIEARLERSKRGRFLATVAQAAGVPAGVTVLAAEMDPESGLCQMLQHGSEGYELVEGALTIS